MKSICIKCQKTFSPTIGSYGKFCSLSCSTSFRNMSKKEASISKYMLSPSTCKNCKKVLDYDVRTNKYCSRSCSAKDTNYIDRRRGPIAKAPVICSNIKFSLCSKTNQYFSNRNSDGSYRRSSPYIKTEKEKYYAACRFKFNVYHYPKEFDISLIEKYGWYSCPGIKRKGQKKNTNGVSRDHIISISYGFENNIDPRIISHPANCRIILHSENKIKSQKCDISLEDLLIKISEWEIKYSERNTGIEPVTKDWKSLVLPLN